MTDKQALETLYRSYVVDCEGHKIGSIGQVYVDDESGEPTWITVHTGFLGLKENFVPLEGSSTLDGVINVPFTREWVKKAPAIEPEERLSVEQEEELYRYYRRDKAVLKPTPRPGISPGRDAEESA